MKLKKDEIDFIRESNAIEGVYDDESFAQAIYAWDFLKRKRKLTVDIVLKTHKILMLKQPLQPDQKGYFRKCEVRIGGRYGVPSATVPAAIESWLLDVATTLKVPGKDGEHIKLDHIEYERIHPFVDGNGRTGRFFMNWQRLRCKMPLLVIHEGVEQREYYKWFR